MRISCASFDTDVKPYLARRGPHAAGAARCLPIYTAIKRVDTFEYLFRKALEQMSDDAQNLAPLPSIGTQATLSRTITENDILLFAIVSGDRNPIHLDADYAERSLFGKRIAHGFLIGSLISAVLGNHLPGPGSIYLGQTLKFLAPIHIGDTVTVTVKVVALREDKRIVTLHTDCINQHGTLVLSGEATVKYMREVAAA